jgi:hypothetical protein
MRTLVIAAAPDSGLLGLVQRARGFRMASIPGRTGVRRARSARTCPRGDLNPYSREISLIWGSHTN